MNDWVNVELFRKTKKGWPQKILELLSWIPSHDAFGRVFAQIDVPQFETCFMNWTQRVQKRSQGEIVAIDWKQLRRSHDRTLGIKTINMVDVWAIDNQMNL
jgi:hypothetical protein